MKKIDYLKTIKIAIGCCCGYLIAELLHLKYSTSVITITLLSILNTKKETFQVAARRLTAFFCAILISSILFPLSHYSILSLFLYLLLYHSICQFGRFTEGFSMSTVLILHIWKEKSFSSASFLNEFCLMSIGILMAIFMNVYMPNRISRICSAQKEIENQISYILALMSHAIFLDIEDKRITSALDVLHTTLYRALSDAKYTEQNFLFKDMSYYSLYIEMRISQYELLKQIQKHLPKLHEPYTQTQMAANFLKQISVSMDEYNNAEELLRQLSDLRKEFKTTPLPISRTEFESRAVLYEIVNELHELLLVKKYFADHLTSYQIKTFWKESK